MEIKKKELEDKAKAEADRLKKEAEDKAKADVDKLKKEAEEKTRQEKEKLKKEAEKKAEEIVKDIMSNHIKEYGTVVVLARNRKLLLTIQRSFDAHSISAIIAQFIGLSTAVPSFQICLLGKKRRYL